MHRAAFTMIEMLAVIVVLGLLAGAAAWSLAGDAEAATYENVVGKLAHHERTARLAANRLGQTCVLRYNLNAQRISRFDTADRMATPAWRLPAPYRIDRIVIHRPGGGDDAGHHGFGERYDAGTVEIDISRAGRSATYAIRVANNQQQGWLVFSGLTGQMTRINDAQEVDNLFAMLAGERPDAD